MNGQSIRVDSNLASALEDLRYTDRTRSLWVDTLSINPGDIEERNSQVSLLAPNLLQARSVCIWVDKGNVESHLAFSSYRSISGNGASDDINTRYLEVQLARLLGKLFERSWFNRGAVQAICLARSVPIH